MGGRCLHDGVGGPCESDGRDPPVYLHFSDPGERAELVGVDGFTKLDLEAPHDDLAEVP